MKKIHSSSCSIHDCPLPCPILQFWNISSIIRCFKIIVFVTKLSPCRLNEMFSIFYFIKIKIQKYFRSILRLICLLCPWNFSFFLYDIFITHSFRQHSSKHCYWLIELSQLSYHFFIISLCSCLIFWTHTDFEICIINLPMLVSLLFHQFFSVTIFFLSSLS